MEKMPGSDDRWLEESTDETERERRLRILHSRYDAALDGGDWKGFQDSYRKYLDLYLEDDPHYADPIVRRDYIRKQLERYRPRFCNSGGSQRLMWTIIWTLLGLVALAAAYFLIWGTGG